MTFKLAPPFPSFFHCSDSLDTVLYNICYTEEVPQAYRAPSVPASKVTPAFVRDELLTCFESANREFLRILNQPVSDDALKQQVRQFVTSVFSQCGVNFEKPTRLGIETAIAECKRNAESMMGPKGTDIIRHHYNEMMKLVTRLPA